MLDKQLSKDAGYKGYEDALTRQQLLAGESRGAESNIPKQEDFSFKATEQQIKQEIDQLYDKDRDCKIFCVSGIIPTYDNI
jgi:hypothetical protein